MRECFADLFSLNGLLLFGCLAVCVSSEVVKVVLDIGCTNEQITLGYVGLGVGLVVGEFRCGARNQFTWSGYVCCEIFQYRSGAHFVVANIARETNGFRPISLLDSPIHGAVALC